MESSPSHSLGGAASNDSLPALGSTEFVGAETGDDDDATFREAGNDEAGGWPEEEEAPERLRGLDWFLARPLCWRRDVVRQPWLLPMAAMHLAAVAIQRAWRSSWLRLARPSAAAQGLGGTARAGRSALPEGRAAATRRLRAGLSTGPPLKQRYFASLREQYEQRALLVHDRGRDGGGAHATFEDYCAALIQRAWRAQLRWRRQSYARRYASINLYSVAAFEIQHAWRDLCAHRRRQMRSVGRGLSRRGPTARRQLAARMLQRAWRSMINCRVYESLRDTIAAFRRSGDPFLLLRTVLPREAMLLDPAMQAHVRFRLGGCRFPPSIYFKIYTHGAIVDLCSFAPRNYAAERNPKLSLQDQEGWYEREENNGWRPLASRFFPGEPRAKDEVERASSRRPVRNFHFSRLRRRQDMEQRRRRRTVQWMRKLYGLAPPEEGEEEAGRGAGAAAAPGAEGWGRPASAGLGGPGARAAPAGAPAAGAPSARRAGAGGGAGAPEPRPPAGPPPGSRSGRRRPPSGGGLRAAAASAEAPAPERARAGGAAAALGGRGGAQAAAAELARLCDEELDELSDDVLLEWSRKLDFEAYIESWKTSATSDGSEGTLPISTATHVRSLAPFGYAH